MDNLTLLEDFPSKELALTDGILVRNIDMLKYYKDNNTYHKLFICIGALAFDIILFALIYILSLQFNTFKNLNYKRKVFWCLAGVRAFFGIHSTLLSFLILFYDDPLKNDIVNGKTLTSDIFTARTVGFFIFENIFLFLSDFLFGTFNHALAIHHILGLIAYTMSLFLGQGHFFGMLGTLMEMSTPSSALCWMFIQCGLSNSFLWKLNQHSLIYLFNTRQTLTFVGAYYIIKEWESIAANMNPILAVLVAINVIVVSVALNPYWTYKKTTQLFTGNDWNFAEKKEITNEQAQKIHTACRYCKDNGRILKNGFHKNGYSNKAYTNGNCLASSNGDKKSQ